MEEIYLKVKPVLNPEVWGKYLRGKNGLQIDQIQDVLLYSIKK